MNYLKLLILISIFLTSCTKEIEIESLTDNTPVVNAIFTPNSSISIHLSLPSAMDATATKTITDATIEIYENDSLLFKLKDYDKDGWYKTYYIPQKNKTYLLKIKTKEHTLTTYTTIPKKTEINTATIKLTGRVNDENAIISRLSLKFKDEISKKNYYELTLFHDNSKLTQQYPYEKITNIILINEGMEDYYPSSIFFSDELFNGDTANVYFDVTFGTETDLNGNRIPRSKLQFQLRSISKEYYLYRKSWTKHYYNQQNENNSGDIISIIFLGEPIEMYSNITNGYGIFGSYSISSKENVLQIK